jgi:thymidylate kinase
MFEAFNLMKPEDLFDLSGPKPAGPLIIVEGPVRTGKTTLARTIAQEAAPAGFINCEGIPDRPGTVHNEEKVLATHHAFLIKAQKLRREGCAVVFDRHWITHVIYGCASGKLKPSQAATYRAWNEALLIQLGAFYVFCLDTADLTTNILVRKAYEDEAKLHQRSTTYYWTQYQTPEALRSFAKLVISLAVEPPAPNNHPHP